MGIRPKKNPDSPSSTEEGVADALRPDPQASAAPAAAPLEGGTPGIGSRVKARAKAVFRVLRRRRVVIVGGAIALLALNVWLAIAVDGWRGEDAALRAENEGLGLELAEARATAAYQVEEIALVTKQAAAAQAKAD